MNTLEPGTFESLKKIYKYLFEEIYEFAGNLRNVNMAKRSFRFTPLTYLEEAIKNKDTEIKELLKKSLTDKIDDREVYMNGIDNSYLYEGYLSFKIHEL